MSEMIAPNGQGEIESYYCPMHPTYKSDRPGDCPICNMALVPKRKTSAQSVSATDGRVPIDLPPARQQLIGVRLGIAQKGKVSKTIRASARVDFDERKLSAVTLKFNGWVEELFVNAVGQDVKIGDPLLRLYSPELLEAQRNYLLASESLTSLEGKNSDSLPFAKESARSARERLLLWDLNENQLRDLETKKEPETRLTFQSNAKGIVTKRHVVKGSYVMAGTELYEIADLSTVWVIADVYEYELPEIQVGQEADITVASSRGESVRGKVTYIYPTLNEATRTARVRLEVENPEGKLKPGMYGEAAIHVDLGEQLTVDAEAIIDSGTRQLVFVDRGEGRLEPREVEVGARADGKVIIRKGLEEGEKVVTSGNFLIDSESRLQAALMAGSEPTMPAMPEHQGHGK